MSRNTRERRLEAEQHWPTLYQLLGGYFGQDVFFEFETLPNAIKAAALGFDLADQKQAAREWSNWNQRIGSREEIRANLDAYGVELDFGSEAEAREFMNEIYDALIAQIRQHDHGWKP